MSEFVECDTCRAKPGTPLLCPSCLANRSTMIELEAANALLRDSALEFEKGWMEQTEEVERLTAELAAARRCFMLAVELSKQSDRVKWNPNGYWIDGAWQGKTLVEAIEAVAAAYISNVDVSLEVEKELAAANALLAKATEFEANGFYTRCFNGKWLLNKNGSHLLFGIFDTAAAAVEAVEKASKPRK